MPGETGHWWFYGDPYVDNGFEIDVELLLVEVTENNGSMLYMARHRFLYESKAKGLWKEADLPERPDKKRG